MRSQTSIREEQIGACKRSTSHTNATCHAHTQMQKPLTTTCNKLMPARHEIQKMDAGRKKVGTATSPRTSTTTATQMQHVTHTQMQTNLLNTTCNKFVLARHEIQKMAATRKKVGTATSPLTSITQATQMQHVARTQTQTKPLTTTCIKFISARHGIWEKVRERKKDGTATSPRTGHTHATCLENLHVCSIFGLPLQKLSNL